MMHLKQERTELGISLQSCGRQLSTINANITQHHEAIRLIRGNYVSKTMGNASSNELLLTEARNLSKIVNWRFDVKTKSLSCPNNFFPVGIHTDYLAGFKAYVDLMGLEEGKILPTAIRQILKTGKPYVIAYHLASLDGEKIILQHGYCEKDLNGKIVALLGTLEDVSESNKLAKQLKDLKEQYQLLRSSLPSPKQNEKREVTAFTKKDTPFCYVNHDCPGNPEKAFSILKPEHSSVSPCHLITITKSQPEKKAVLVEKMKALINQLVQGSNEQMAINFSQYLSEQLNYNYKYLSSIFSEHHGETIQHFFSSEKIEEVKQLISAGELNLTEIAFKLHYSSVSHLSNQFKTITGITPSQYKLLITKAAVAEITESTHQQI